MTLTRSVAVSAALLIGATAVTSCARTRAAEDRYPPLGQFVTVDDRRVHYVQTGSGPDLVLIHGASGNVRDWTFDFVDRVKDRYRVTVFDRPGLGYTDPDPAYAGAFDGRAEGPEAQARLLHAAAERVGVSSEVVVGHSYGGAVAMAWALNHDPAAAVIVSGATEPWPGGLGFMYNLTGTSLGGAVFVPLVSAFVPRGIAKSAIASIFDPNTPPDGYADYVGAGLTLRAESFRTNAQQVKTLRPHVVQMSERYPDLRLPLELVHGTADDVVPIDIHSEVLVKQVPGATLTRLDGVGHMPHHIAPQAVVDAIDRAAGRAGLR